MNHMESKIKRRDYQRQLTELTADGKVVFYLDETNFNVWCSRLYGEARLTSVRRQFAHITRREHARDRVYLKGWPRVIRASL